MLLTAVLMLWVVNGNSLQELLVSKLSSTSRCDATNQICAITPVTFEDKVSNNFPPCCQASFPCSSGGASFKRELGNWKIDQEGSNFEEPTCFGTSPSDPCNCQDERSNNAEKNISFSLCQKELYCCPTCSCRGDPHCKSFENKYNNWVVCDNRDTNCKFKRTNDGSCQKITYQGKNCVFRKDASGKGYCQWDNSPASALSPPKMRMYQKKYIKDGVEKEFFVELLLAVYGSIGGIIVQDGDSRMEFILKYGPVVCSFPGDLIAAGKLTRNVVGKVENYRLENLDSGVTLHFRCAKGNSELGSRYDVEELRDPEFDPFNPIPSASGFCVDSKINEMIAAETQTKCSNVDGVLIETPFFKNCVRTQPQACKTAWCSQAPFDKPASEQLNYQIIGFRSQTECHNYVNSATNDGKNFARALCASSYKVRLANPTQCENDEACRECLNDITDFPDQIEDNLLPAKDAITAAPTSRENCPTDEQFTQQGLKNTELFGFGGIQIEYKATESAEFVPIFGVTDDKIAIWNACRNQCGAPFGNNDPTFSKPGFYRMMQTIVPSSTDKCKGATGYTVSISYQKTLLPDTFVSKPFGPLFRSGVLVCRNTKKLCPPNYTCCIYDVKSPGWLDCMKSFPGNFPDCENDL